MMSMPSSAARRRSAPLSVRFVTICANGSPGATSPSKVRKTGRTGSAVRESVTIISVIACACGAISAQQPSCSSMRQAAAAMAEARPSRSQTPAGRGVDDGDCQIGPGGCGSTRRRPGRHSRRRRPARRAGLFRSAWLSRSIWSRPCLCLSLRRLDFGRRSVRNRAADHTAIGDGHVASHARASRHSRPRAARTQSVSWSQPQGRLAARVRRPGHRPGAGRRAAHRRAGAPRAFAAWLFHAAGRYRACRSSTRSTASATAAPSPRGA